MEAEYDLPSGDRVRVVDTETAARHLGTMLRRFRGGDHEPLFYGDAPKPEGVIISFDQWAEYETLRIEAETDRRVEQITAERLATTPLEDYVPLEDMARDLGWDLDADSGTPTDAEEGPASQDEPPSGR